MTVNSHRRKITEDCFLLLYTNSNMAEKKKEESSSGGESLLWGVIGAVIVIFIISAYIGRTDFNSVDDLSKNILPAESLDIGSRIINKKIVKVRQSVGGAIIGEQSKREVGKILGEQTKAFGETWYQVDYENAPDGWVSSGDITNKISLFRSLNIFPIVFGVLRPIGFVLIVIFLILIGFVMSKQRQVDKLLQKRKEVEKQSIQQKKEREIEKTGTEIPGLIMGGSGEISTVPDNLPTGDMGGLEFESIGQEMKSSGPRNIKWERVERLMDSHNSSDWKQAIIEADILLDSMLTQMGYEGNSIGEQLKQIEESDFVTLNKAWEAHKFRNHIAHKGGDFTFSKSEAERIIGLYQKVFEEFFYI